MYMYACVCFGFPVLSVCVSQLTLTEEIFPSFTLSWPHKGQSRNRRKYVSLNGAQVWQYPDRAAIQQEFSFC